MDVESLYPSLRSDDCAQIVRETIMDSDLSVEELNWKEMSIILRKNLSNEEIAACDLCELIPKKEKKPKKHMDIKDDEKCDDNLWTFPNDSPSNLDIKKLFAETMSVVVKLVMNNHVYKFADKLRVQENEGGIGVTLTGILSELKMLLWGIKFKDKLNYLKIKNDVYDRFVDDITLLPTVLPPGTTFDGDDLNINDDKFEEDI